MHLLMELLGLHNVVELVRALVKLGLALGSIKEVSIYHALTWILVDVLGRLSVMLESSLSVVT